VRISKIDDRWYMTTCSVSVGRHCTTMHISRDGLSYSLEGIVLDHQNKDMILFEGKVGGRFVALTRPLGELYFAYPLDSPYAGGPSINLVGSPDALHWKSLDQPGIRARRNSTSSMKIGGGSQRSGRTGAGS
jgi:beta-1,2-mannobiose phosphorylase / 1,2-beta-oligomannan phosphorylase